MTPWELLDRAQADGDRGELRLYRRGSELSIRVDGAELMNSNAHGSEEALAELACSRIAGRAVPRVLIGGLGMGFTMAAALRGLGTDGEVVVAELVPAVVKWNRGVLSALAGHPLCDRRATVREADVADILRSDQGEYDAILLDVDNGPGGLTRKGNDWLYSAAGLAAASSALRPRGVLGIWSACSDRAFTRRLRQAGFETEEIQVRARGRRRGGHHTIWLAGRTS